MANPLQAAWSYLRGEDFKAKLTAPEQKLQTIPDMGAVLKAGILVSGPGASLLQSWPLNEDANSAVFACLMALATAYIEAPLKVYLSAEQGQREWQPEHPAQSLFDEPNPWHTIEELKFFIEWCKHLDGNAYLRKIRSGNSDSGNVVELYPVPFNLMQPITERGSDQLIDYYEYKPAPGKKEQIDVANVMHFRQGIDPSDLRKGISPIKRLVRELATDDEATRFTSAFLQNYGVPGIVITVPDADFSLDKALAIKSKFKSEFGSDNRGNVGILNNGATASTLGNGLEGLDLKALHQLPESRIAAVMRVPAVVAGLSVGLEKSGQYSNFREARAQFTESTILPEYQLDAARWNRSLLRDFTSDRRLRINYDITDMRVLQDDEDAKYKRLDLGVQTGWILPDEARADVGLPPMANGQGALPMPKPVTGGLSLGKHVAELERKGIDVAQFPELYAAMIELAAPRLQSALEEYFDGQRKRVKRALLAGGNQ